MSSSRHKSHKRTHSRSSPSSRRNSAHSSSEDRSEHSPPKRHKNKEDGSLEKILKSIETLTQRIDSLETRSLQREIIPSVSDVHEDDTLSIMAGIADFEHSPDSEATVEPIKASVEPVQASSVEPIKAPVGPNGAPQKSNIPSSDHCVNTQENSALAEGSGDNHILFDPLASSTSWTTSVSFSKFLDTNFRRKLNYQQSLTILDDWSIPQVDALQPPKLDQQLLNQVPQNMKKFVQERDKEMFTVQRAFLNATGPLCGLHDCIENGSSPSYEDLKLALEQSLCLLGSANTQLSILRRQRVLAAINRSRINLAELPLPNAKTWLFGDDFPSLASKQAELSRGLTKNLSQTANKSFSKRATGSFSQAKYRGQNFSKYSNKTYSNASRSQSNYQGSRSKNGNFRPPKGRQPNSQDA